MLITDNFIMRHPGLAKMAANISDTDMLPRYMQSHGLGTIQSMLPPSEIRKVPPGRPFTPSELQDMARMAHRFMQQQALGKLPPRLMKPLRPRPPQPPASQPTLPARPREMPTKQPSSIDRMLDMIRRAQRFTSKMLPQPTLLPPPEVQPPQINYLDTIEPLEPAFDPYVPEITLDKDIERRPRPFGFEGMLPYPKKPTTWRERLLYPLEMQLWHTALGSPEHARAAMYHRNMLRRLRR